MSKVICWTPYGREETVSILHKYMQRDKARAVVDEWWLCMNTDPEQERDRQYAQELTEAHSWIKIKYFPPHLHTLYPKQRNTGYFYEHMTDPDSIFIRFDDDIVYVHDKAIERLVVRRKEISTSLCLFPIIWNNSVVSWFLQQAGVIPKSFGIVGGPYCMDPLGWADAEFGIKMHRLLLKNIKEGTVDKLFLYQDYSLPVGLQFSVSCFASLGADYAALPTPGVLTTSEEESWHTIHQPLTTGRPNMIIGDALVSHFTFYPQREIIRATDILDQYREIANNLEAKN